MSIRIELTLWQTGRTTSFLANRSYNLAILKQIIIIKHSLNSVSYTHLDVYKRQENRSLYRFFLSDSIDIDGRKNFVIRFRDAGIKKPVPQRKFNGYIYVDAETYGPVSYTHLDVYKRQQ